MHRTGFAITLFAAALTLTGCRGNPLPDYAPRIKVVRTSTFAPRGPYVNLDTGGSSDSPIGLVKGLVSAGASAGIQERISKVATPRRLTDTMNASLIELIPQRFAFETTVDPRSEHDASLEVTIHDYGIVSWDITTPAHWRLRADARLVFRPENKVVWQTVEVFEYPVQNVPFGGAVVNSVMNVTSLTQLTDPEVEEIFDRMTRDAANAIIERMVRDSARR